MTFSNSFFSFFFSFYFWLISRFTPWIGLRMDSGWLAAVKINFSEFGENNFFRFSKKCRRNLSLVSSMGWNFRSKLLQKKKRRGTYLIFPVIYFPNMLGRFWLRKTCRFRTFGLFLSRKYFDMCIYFVAQFYPLSLIIFPQE